MSKIETFVMPGATAEVQRRGALPVAPLTMPAQRLERPRRRLGRLQLLALAIWGRPTRAGR